MKKIRFYDNDQTHIENVQKNSDIECIKVNSQITKVIMTDIRIVKEEMKDNKFFNKYVKKIIEGSKSPPESKLNYDETSGITFDDMNDLIEWARRGGEIVIFDFDRTIIKTEGFGIFYHSKEHSDHWFGKDLNTLMEGYIKVDSHEVESTVDDFLAYICGGKQRLDNLREMFRKLNALNVRIYINSMNLACDSKLFRDVVKRIVVVDHEIQCSVKERGKLHEIKEMLLKKRLHSSTTSSSPSYSSSSSPSSYEDESNVESPIKKVKKSLDGRAKKAAQRARASRARRRRSKCKTGYEMNRKTKRCRKSCVLGQRRSGVTGRCKKSCAVGKRRSRVTGRCRKSK